LHSNVAPAARNAAGAILVRSPGAGIPGRVPNSVSLHTISSLIAVCPAKLNEAYGKNSLRIILK
jgi:hypothetical protein